MNEQTVTIELTEAEARAFVSHGSAWTGDRLDAKNAIDQQIEAALTPPMPQPLPDGHVAVPVEAFEGTFVGAADMRNYARHIESDGHYRGRDFLVDCATALEKHQAGQA